MDYFIVVLLAAMWIASVIGAYSAGWMSGWDKSQAHHKWSRWLLQKYENRSVRF
jgi:Mn2+/Fe2+ NRAMP family transporter